MQLSTIVVSYNVKELLKECLLSVELSTKSLSNEIFVVDNDSKDGSAELVKEKFPYVKLIANKKNLGFSRANNQALKKASGEYLLVLNPDTRLMPETIVKMIDFMKENKNVGIATCRVELPNGSLDLDCRRRFPTPWRAFTYFSKLSKIFKGSTLFDQYYMGDISDEKAHEIDACVGAFMFIKKSALNKVGFFDEDFFFYGEDLDLCWRFREQEFKIFYTPTTKIIHYKGASSGMKKASQSLARASKESRKKALAESVRSMEIFYRKHYIGKYPFFVTWAVLTSFKILGKIRLSSV